MFHAHATMKESALTISVSHQFFLSQSKDALRAPINVGRRPTGAGNQSEFRRELDFIPAAVNGPADERLVATFAVRVRRVEKCHAEVERAMDSPNRFSVVRRAVALGHPHAAEADGRNR